MNRLHSTVWLLLITSSSFAVEGVALTATGDQIPYMTYGSGDPTLVLIHGWTNNRTFWEPHIPELSKDHQVVTLDLASFGESLYQRNDWSMRAFALDVDAVLDDLGTDEAVLVGFSMGGTVALELASLGRQYVKGVVLVDIHKDPEWQSDDSFIEEAAEHERRMWGTENAFDADFSEGASKTLVQRYLTRTPETVPNVWWDSLRQFFIWTREDLSERVALIDAPIVAINSSRGSTNVEAWNRIAPGFRVHVIDGVGHLGMIWEEIEEFDQALLKYVSQFEQ